MDKNTQGRYYETLFKAECLKRGLIVLSPECTHLPFDMAVFSGGRFLKVQVKGTSSLAIHHKTGGRGWSREYRVDCRTGNNVNYRDLGVDFLAAYVEPKKTWYIVPSVLLTGSAFRIAKDHEQGRAALCHERWDYLGA